MSKELKARVRLGYSRTWVVDKYATVGLWPSEAHLTQTFWPPEAHILDLGCGAGRTTVPLGQQNYRVVGADLSHPMVQKAQAQSRQWHLNNAWSVADATDLPFIDNHFDGVLFSYNGIELVPPGREGKKRVLEEVFRVLKPGGHFIFTTHAIEALNRYAPARLHRLIRYLFAKSLRRPTPEMEIGEVIPDTSRNLEVYYMQIISPRSYRNMLKQAGFDLVYYNSRQRIETQKPPKQLWADLDPDFKFYVAQKPFAPNP